jgi:SAM-dependent methyltransferase
VPALPTWRPLTVPDGWTIDDLRAAMSTFSIDGSPPGALDGYWEEAFGRFLHTWQLAREEKGRALELGANPYFLTWLLTRFTDLDLSLGNYFNVEPAELTQHVTVDEKGARAELSFTSDMYNIEEDRFPYEDDTFDVVFFCEIIEHLLVNPLRPLGEIHRILRPGGVLILTTPNAVRLEVVLAAVAGSRLFDQYSGHGPYGRHNHEFVRADLVSLLEFGGFAVETCFSADSHPVDLTGHPLYPTVAPALGQRSEDLGQYFFVRARVTSPPRQGLPRFLFRSWPEDQLVD